MANIYIKGWGCTANQDNEAILAGLAIEAEHTLVATVEDADLIILNTCTVKATTEQKILSMVKYIEQLYPEKKIILTGCMSGAQPEQLHELQPNVSLVSTQHITEIIPVIEKMMHGEIVSLTTKRKETKLNLPKQLRKDGVGIIQIGEGCADTCYFCATKLAKGHIVSFPIQDIITQTKKYLQQNIKTIYLTSQDNGAYGLDTNKVSQLAVLLQALINIEGDFQIRVGMANPRHLIPILNDLLTVYKSPKIKKFLHIPVQAGSEKVLQEMNRKHSANDFKILSTAFRKEFTDMNIATDIICGYPTETEQDFEETMKLMKETKPEVINISRFTPRPGTRAAKLKPLTSQELKRRSSLLAQSYRTFLKERQLQYNESTV